MLDNHQKSEVRSTMIRLGADEAYNYYMAWLAKAQFTLSVSEEKRAEITLAYQEKSLYVLQCALDGEIEESESG